MIFLQGLYEKILSWHDCEVLGKRLLLLATAKLYGSCIIVFFLLAVLRDYQGYGDISSELLEEKIHANSTIYVSL